MLGYLEIHLIIGTLPPDFKKHSDALTQDENVKALLGALNPRSEEEAKASVATLTRLAPLAGDKAHVTGIFRANMERSLGNNDVATSLFVAALTKNPFITGVWKDLGDILDTGYDAGDTWRCYAIARLIAPSHSLLAEVDRREAALRKEHAAFF